MILFDTSAVIHFLKKGAKTKELAEGEERSGGRLATTSISLFELLSPIYHWKLQREERVLRSFIRSILVLGLDFQSAEEASKIMGSLLRLGKPVNALDVLIAGIGISNNADLVVTKDKDFLEIEKVSDLRVELVV